MFTKFLLKEKAVELRKQGRTYSEILKIVPVAKSTLSEWLKSVGLAKAQVQRITEKKRLGQFRGAMARRNQRIKIFDQITGFAEKEIGKMTKRELWLIGIALYWAEGSKEKEGRWGSGIRFSNSDYQMVNLFLKWLFEAVNIPKEEINCEIYIHDSYCNEVARFQKYWSGKTGLPLSYFKRVYFKRNKINTKRKNVGDLYNGQLSVRVCRSSSLNRRVTGWVRGINKYWGIV